jgi:hypothetical protein
MNVYELQSVCPETGALEIVAECEAESASEARPLLMRRAGIETRDCYGSNYAAQVAGYEIAWDNGRIAL